jgi:hypothetical protein
MDTPITNKKSLYNKNFYQKHRDKLIEQNKENYQKKKEEIKEKQKERYKQNKQYYKDYYQKRKLEKQLIQEIK